MAPAARKDRAETSLGKNPRSIPGYFTASRRGLVMSVGVTDSVPARVKTRPSGTWGAA